MAVPLFWYRALWAQRKFCSLLSQVPAPLKQFRSAQSPPSKMYPRCTMPPVPEWRAMLIILNITRRFHRWNWSSGLLPEMKAHNFNNILFQKLSRASYFKKNIYIYIFPSTHHTIAGCHSHSLCWSPVAEHFNQLALCCKDLLLIYKL